MCSAWKRAPQVPSDKGTEVPPQLTCTACSSFPWVTHCKKKKRDHSNTVHSSLWLREKLPCCYFQLLNEISFKTFYYGTERTKVAWLEGPDRLDWFLPQKDLPLPNCTYKDLYNELNCPYEGTWVVFTTALDHYNRTKLCLIERSNSPKPSNKNHHISLVSAHPRKTFPWFSDSGSLQRTPEYCCLNTPWTVLVRGFLTLKFVSARQLGHKNTGALIGWPCPCSHFRIWWSFREGAGLPT